MCKKLELYRKTLVNYQRTKKLTQRLIDLNLQYKEFCLQIVIHWSCLNYEGGKVLAYGNIIFNYYSV